MKNSSSTKTINTKPGAAVYSRITLLFYDYMVIHFSNRFAWRCPSRYMIELYNRHITANHLDIGVGTGYFLDRCRFPIKNPYITLFDFNPHSLTHTANRIKRFNPLQLQGDVFNKNDMPKKTFSSIGINYLLHCLPGRMSEKAPVFKNLSALLHKNGVLFGSTILGKDENHNRIARTLMRIYNKKGIFTNQEDSRTELEKLLKMFFSKYTIEVKGTVALFQAVK